MSVPLLNILRAHDHITKSKMNVNTVNLVLDEEIIRALRNGIQINQSLGNIVSSFPRTFWFS